MLMASGTTLKSLYINLVDDHYENWMAEFFRVMSVSELHIGTFAVSTLSGVERRAFLLPRYRFEILNI